MLQVEKEHYDFDEYANKNRWASYWHQIDEVLKTKAKSILIIGVGDGIVPSLLRHILADAEETRIYTFDFDKTLKPDFVGDLRKIKSIIKDMRFDCILCSQVLEHIEYRYINSILKFFSAISKNVIISVPYSYRSHFKVEIKIPKIPGVMISTAIPQFYKEYEFSGEHYWELGRKGYSKQKFKNMLLKYFLLIREYHVNEHYYHVFYILKSS